MKKMTFTALVLASALAMSACGSSEPAKGTAGSGGTTKVTVGTLPILPTAAIMLGMDKGFFAKEGLDVKLETGQGGAALVPAVMSGQMQFATGNPISLLQARDKGLDVRVVSSYTYDTDKGVHAVLTRPDSGIKTAKDLVGKKVAVNTLKSMGDLLIMDAVKKDGGDPKAVSFVELPYPNMEAALQSGQVDAVWTPEPFMTIIRKADNPVVTYPGVASVKGHPTMVYFASGTLVKSKPELVSAMAKAINATMDYAQAHPDEVRAKAASALKIDPALSKAVVLEDMGGPVRKDELTAMGGLMKEYGVITKDADVVGLLQSVPKP